MNLETFRSWIRKYAPAVVAVLSVCVLIAYLIHSSDTMRTIREHERLQTVYSKLEDARPPGVQRSDWVRAWGYTQTAIGNVCTIDHVDVNELTKFRKELERRSRKEINVQTLVWIWNELERLEPTGRYGDEYVEGYRPLFEDALGLNGKDD